MTSADFDEFDELPETDEEYVYEEEYDEGYKETDRIDVQTPLVIDPNALVYSQQSAPYGKEYPSYVPESFHTMVGTLDDRHSSKTFDTDAFYGKFPEGAHATKNLNLIPEAIENEYYDDEFEYYDDDYYLEEDLKQLKHKLGIAPESANEPKQNLVIWFTNLHYVLEK